MKIGHVSNNCIKYMSHRHEGILEFLLMNQDVPNKTIAKMFGVTEGWLSRVLHSEAFQTRYKEIHGETWDEKIMPLQEKMEALAHLCVDRLTEQVAESEDGAFIKDATDKILHRIGFAPSSKGPILNIQAGNGAQVQVNQVNREDLERAKELRHAAHEVKLAREEVAAKRVGRDLPGEED